MIKKIIYLSLVTALLLGCGGPTRVNYQELPRHKPLALKINDVTLRVVSYGYTKDWSELEIAVLNESDEPVHLDATQIFLTNEKGYDLAPLRAPEINERVRRKTGQWVTPLTIGAIAAGVAAIVAPSSKDRTAFGRGALALAAGAGVSELAKRQSAEADIKRKDDILLRTYNIPPKLQLGGVLYYPPSTSIEGVKAFIRIEGQEEYFHIAL
jgi:hypothetical protein